MTRFVCRLLLFSALISAVLAGTVSAGQVADHPPQRETYRLDLEGCLSIALERNRSRRVSQIAVDIAEAQYQQALSAYWPQVKAVVSATRMDEGANFIFPEETATYKISGFGPLLSEATVTVPEKDVKLMDRDTVMGSLQVVYPVYLGGKRSALRAQARVGVEAARVSARKTDLQVIYDVKRMYYGSLLTRQLRELGNDSLERFKITLELTEHLYQSGVGRVKKTDYLRTQVMVATIRSMQELLKSNEELAQSALLNFMGLEWESRLILEAQAIPFAPYQGDLKSLVGEAYEFNPDWRSLHLGLAAAEARIKEARSGHLPMVALTGSLNHIDNPYDKGIMTPANKDSWTLGIGLEIPLFAGFRTTHAVKEARARLAKLEQQRFLLQEGIALMVKDAYLQVQRAREQVLATRASLDAARENRDLNMRAYQSELVETRDVIEAQLLESFVCAQHYKALHDHVTEQARLGYIVGSQVEKILDEGIYR